MEMALLDLWGHVAGKSVYELLYMHGDMEMKDWRQIESFDKSTCRSFYTAGLNQNVMRMVESAEFGRRFTPLLKIKVDGNVKKCSEIFSVLFDTEPEAASKSKNWSVDANAGWNPQIAMECLALLKPIRSKIFMCEQPFPLIKAYKGGLDAHEQAPVRACVYEDEALLLSEEDTKALLQEWKAIKSAYNEEGILIYADESVSCVEDLMLLHSIADGINIKLEKSGGIREALRIYEKSQQLHMRVWIGTMVGSVFNSTVAACLLPLATEGLGDVDGALLVTEASQLFNGGMKLETPETGALSFSDERGHLGFGLGLKATHDS